MKTILDYDDSETSQKINSWPDGWLVAAVRSDPPNEEALDVLAGRYQKELMGRCQSMTYNFHKASDLAQGTWCRVLRARHSLKPDGNFPAYLMTIATNLWRDSFRSSRRAGPFSENRLASLDAEITNDEGEASVLGDRVPDLSTLPSGERTLLRIDIERALSLLPALLRDVLVSRFVEGESCAEIGERYNRTEQTVSAWVREGIRQMKQHLEEPETTSV